MKKSLLRLGLALVLTLTCATAQAAAAAASSDDLVGNPAVNPAGNPVDQFTGEIWVDTTESDKAAYLFGIDSAVTVEYFVNARQTAKAAKAGKKPVYTLSPFEKGWMEAFSGVSRAEIIKMVDEWYAAHPKDLQRPVMSVIWYELIEPRLAGTRK